MSYTSPPSPGGGQEKDYPAKHPQATEGDELVTVGLIKGAWGIRGDVKVEILTDFLHRFSPGSRLLLDSQPTEVQSSRRYKGGFIVKLRGIDSRSAAEAAPGKLLQVSRDCVESLPTGRYYHFQILDMQVRTKEGRYLGIVKEILSPGSNDVYVVRDDSREVLIPALEDVVLAVDIENGRMTVDLPEGLL